jgi:hypothetical protein
VLDPSGLPPFPHADQRYQLRFQTFQAPDIRRYGTVEHRAMINAGILARATRRGYAITQIGVHHFPRTCGRPTGANPRVILRAFRELVKLYRQINR